MYTKTQLTRKLAEQGQLLRRKPHQPAPLTTYMRSIAAELVRHKLSEAQPEALLNAATRAPSVDAGIKAIEAAS